MTKLVIDSEYWQYCPDYYPKPERTFQRLYDEIKDMCQQYMIHVFSQDFPSRRISAVFTDDTKRMISGYPDYARIPTFTWDESKRVSKIKKIAEAYNGDTFAYALVHIYRDGTDVIGWHNDREALDTPVLSLSFGATRKFRIREMGEKKGWLEELELGPGSLVYMKPRMQRMYKHCVPQQKLVKGPRINLTFRKWQN